MNYPIRIGNIGASFLSLIHRFALIVLLIGLTLSLTGCPLPNQTRIFDNGANGLIWTQDESKLISISDSSSYCVTNILNKSAAVIASYPPWKFNVNFLFDLWNVSDDSSMLLLINDSLLLFQPLTGVWHTLSHGYGVLAQSPDLRHFILAPISYSGTGTFHLRSVELVGNSFRDIRSWGADAPSAAFELWASPNSIGYFRYNSSHIIDFLLVDSNLAPQDSIATGVFTDVANTQVLHGPQRLYFASSEGIMAVDSITHAVSWLSRASSSRCQMNPDGSMIVCDSATTPYKSQIHLLNTKTGAARALESNTFRYFLSPRGDYLAIIGVDPNTPFHVTVESISPP